MAAMWSIRVWMGWVASWSSSESQRITVAGSSSEPGNKICRGTGENLGTRFIVPRLSPQKRGEEQPFQEWRMLPAYFPYPSLHSPPPHTHTHSNTKAAYLLWLQKSPSSHTIKNSFPQKTTKCTFRLLFTIIVAVWLVTSVFAYEYRYVGFFHINKLLQKLDFLWQKVFANPVHHTHWTLLEWLVRPIYVGYVASKAAISVYVVNGCLPCQWATSTISSLSLSAATWPFAVSLSRDHTCRH